MRSSSGQLRYRPKTTNDPQPLQTNAALRVVFIGCHYTVQPGADDLPALLHLHRAGEAGILPHDLGVQPIAHRQNARRIAYGCTERQLSIYSRCTFNIIAPRLQERIAMKPDILLILILQRHKMGAFPGNRYGQRPRKMINLYREKSRVRLTAKMHLLRILQRVWPNLCITERHLQRISPTGLQYSPGLFSFKE